MTPEILATFAILLAAVVLFVTNWLRMDLVALLVLGALALTGLLTPAEALAGFANPAVVTVWAVFILGAGLAMTGVAAAVGAQIVRVAGSGERRLIVVIVLSAGILSGFMNSIGVVVLLLPVVMDIARQTRIAPSRLLLPLASGALLGGLTTLIGTPPNLIVSETLREGGFAPFSFFAFSPVGLAVLLTGAVYMAVVGRRVLPERHLSRETRPPASGDELKRLYGLEDSLTVVQIRPGSTLVGVTLAQSRLRDITGGNVVGILRNGQTRLAPPPGEVLLAGDRLIIQGTADGLAGVNGQPIVLPSDEPLAPETLTTAEIGISELRVPDESALVGKTLAELALRTVYGVNVLAIRRAGRLVREELPRLTVAAGDALLVQASREDTQALVEAGALQVVSSETALAHQLSDHLAALHVPEASALAGRTLAESRLGAAFDLLVLGIVRDGATRLAPSPGRCCKPATRCW
ncbi:MAG: SLC13 family permease [Caldilineales bacterium]